MGKVNLKQGQREDKRTRAERHDVKKRLAQQVRRADRKSLTTLQRIIALLVIGM